MTLEQLKTEILNGAEFRHVGCSYTNYYQFSTELYSLSDFLDDKWELKPKSITLTREQLAEAIYKQFPKGRTEAEMAKFIFNLCKELYL